MHPVQEPDLVNNGEDELQGQGIRDIMGTWCKSWAVESEESCNAWFVLQYILIIILISY